MLTKHVAETIHAGRSALCWTMAVVGTADDPMVSRVTSACLPDPSRCGSLSGTKLTVPCAARSPHRGCDDAALARSWMHNWISG